VSEKFTELRAGLLADGYEDVPEVDGIKVGARVHHSGERFPRAYWEGTAVVLAVMEKSPSSWSRRWGRRDIEVIIERDRPQSEGMSPVGQWTDYATRVVPAERLTGADQ
jgi:hypothetical protein